eukprot:TRINITY_DN43580_c0_g1_i1.p1 TRINITY_DN43580_c0_g1~~TRINITY_DN43580_c0_g1_i1.p1  ORF type:complete len:342 (+),score=103.23 TRINITY_DN43580_c0_g1_i1:60-1085(+)
MRLNKQQKQMVVGVLFLAALWLVWGVEHTTEPPTGGDISDPSPVTRAPVGSRVVSVPSRSADSHGQPKPVQTPFLEAWGYNWKRNRARWAFLHKEIARDGSASRPFSLVDYGSDEGFFSVSVAKAFPRSVVVGVEMGGVGGSIWKKKGQLDVLKVTENKIREHGVQPRIVMCQTAVKPKHFYALRDAGARHDYQFVLSVFHWFSMPDRAAFEEVLVTMFGNARTTFIEMPIVGDRGPRFSKQVGWNNFLKWYDGRNEFGQVIEDSLNAQNVKGTVRKIGGVKWYPADPKRGETEDWMRDVYRVDIPDGSVEWDCETHFRLYGCNRTTSPSPVRYSKCPDRD